MRTHNTYALRHITIIMKREKYRNDENKAASLCDKLENAEPSEVGASSNRARLSERSKP